MGNVKIIRNCAKKGALKSEFAERPNEKRKLLKRKKRKKRRELNKKSTLAIGMYKNGAKGKEICTAINETNKARLQGDILMLLNGEPSTKNALEIHKVVHNEKKLPEKNFAKKMQENPSMINWTPRHCYETFCSTFHSKNYEIQGSLASECSVSNSVLKIKKTLRQFYSGVFRRQALHTNATKKAYSIVPKSLGHVNGLFSSHDYNLANMDVPAQLYSENSELLLKHMNDIRLDHEICNDSLQITGRVTEMRNRPTNFRDNESKLLPDESFIINFNSKNYQNRNVGPTISQQLEDKSIDIFPSNGFNNPTSLEVNFNTLNTKCATDMGREIIMNRYLSDVVKTSRKDSDSSQSFEGDLMQSNDLNKNCGTSMEKGVEKHYKKNAKHVPAIFRRSNTHNLHKQCHQANSHLRAENYCFTFAENKNPLTTDNKFLTNLFVDKSSAKESFISPAFNQRKTRWQTPLFTIKSQDVLNSKTQFMKAKYNRESQRISPNNIKDITQITNLTPGGTSTCTDIQIINELKNKECNVSENESQERYLENFHLKSYKHKLFKQKKKNMQKHIMNRKQLFRPESASTSNSLEYKQPPLFEEDFDLTYDQKYQKIYNSLPENCETFESSQDKNCNDCHFRNLNYSVNGHLPKGDSKHYELSLENNTDSLAMPSVCSTIQNAREPSKLFLMAENLPSIGNSTSVRQTANGCTDNQQYFTHSRHHKKVPQYIFAKIRDTQSDEIPQKLEILRYPSTNKEYGKRNLSKAIPVFCDNQAQNETHISGMRRVMQPIKYLAVENTANSQQRVPLYFHMPVQHSILELPHRPVTVVKYNEQDLNSTANVIYVPTDKLNRTALRPTLRVAQHNSVPVYETSMKSEDVKRKFIEPIPIGVRQSYSRTMEEQGNLVDGRIGVAVPKYYILHDASNAM